MERDKFDIEKAASAYIFNNYHHFPIKLHNELENYLIEESLELKQHGLTAEEAFFIATKRLGEPDLIAKEYYKVEPFEQWKEYAFIGIGLCLYMGIWQTILNLVVEVLYDFGLNIHYTSRYVIYFAVLMLGAILTYSILKYVKKHQKPITQYLGYSLIFTLFSLIILNEYIMFILGRREIEDIYFHLYFQLGKYGWIVVLGIIQCFMVKNYKNRINVRFGNLKFN